jgi:hypothetical protein
VSAHRGSYAKTVAAAAFATTAALGGAIALLLVVVLADRAAPVAAMAAFGVVALGLVGTATALVAGGGAIALRRDALEARGISYAPSVARERGPGLARRVLRRVRRVVLPGRPVPLRPGDLVEVRSLAEILGTLDARGRLDGLPFMPEMAAHCGRRFRVRRRVDKIYDWVQTNRLRRLRGVVMLEDLTCDGASHGGCQARCLVLWKEAWLRLADGGTAAAPSGDARLTTADLDQLTRRPDEGADARFVCQMTELSQAATELAWHDPRHYLRDFVTGNVRLGPLVTGLAIAAFNSVQAWRGGARYPLREHSGERTSPHGALDLRPGELVRVKPKRDIVRTLDVRYRNRGLWFDGEMLRHCGGTYRVALRVERLLDERSGRLVALSNPCIVLEGVRASGEYQSFAAQAEAIFWREIWLERVGEGPPTD